MLLATRQHKWLFLIALLLCNMAYALGSFLLEPSSGEVVQPIVVDGNRANGQLDSVRAIESCGRRVAAHFNAALRQQYQVRRYAPKPQTGSGKAALTEAIEVTGSTQVRYDEARQHFVCLIESHGYQVVSFVAGNDATSLRVPAS